MDPMFWPTSLCANNSGGSACLARSMRTTILLYWSLPSGVMRSTLLILYSVNQRFPSGPSVIAAGLLRWVESANSLTWPEVVIRPILSTYGSVNQSAPSGPSVIAPSGSSLTGTANSVIAPCGVIAPILLTLDSVNYILPTGPFAIPPRLVLADREYSATTPSVVIRPI